MGAEVTVYVKVQKLCEEWIEVSAVTRLQAEEIALDRVDVITVVESSYDNPAACSCGSTINPHACNAGSATDAQ